MTEERYSVQITRPALRALGRLKPKTAEAVLRFFNGPLTDNPLQVTMPLGAELERQRSGCVGISYRFVTRVAEAERVVYVLRIAHRADVSRGQ